MLVSYPSTGLAHIKLYLKIIFNNNYSGSIIIIIVLLCIVLLSYLLEYYMGHCLLLFYIICFSIADHELSCYIIIYYSRVLSLTVLPQIIVHS